MTERETGGNYISVHDLALIGIFDHLLMLTNCVSLTFLRIFFLYYYLKFNLYLILVSLNIPRIYGGRNISLVQPSHWPKAFGKLFLPRCLMSVAVGGKHTSSNYRDTQRWRPGGGSICYNKP